MLRALGWEQAVMMGSDDLAFAVRRCDADYRLPARLDDHLEVHTRLTAVRGASMDADQIVRKGESDLVRMTVKLACVSGQVRPARIPRDLRAVLQDLCKAGN